MTIEIGITRPDAGRIRRLMVQSRLLMGMMPTTDDDSVLDCVEEVRDLCCEVERILDKAERKGS